MLSNILIANRAMPCLRQLINRHECTIIQQHFSTTFFQISPANTLPVGTLFLTQLITFPNSASFHLLLQQLSLSKLPFKTIQNTLSEDSYRIFQKFYWESLLPGNHVGKLFSTFHNKSVNKLIKSDFLRKSSIGRHSRKIDFFFISPKRTFQ